MARGPLPVAAKKRTGVWARQKADPWPGTDAADPGCPEDGPAASPGGGGHAQKRGVSVSRGVHAVKLG